MKKGLCNNEFWKQQLQAELENIDQKFVDSGSEL